MPCILNDIDTNHVSMESFSLYLVIKVPHDMHVADAYIDHDVRVPL